MTAVSTKVIERNIYTDGTSLEKNPGWHTDESPFKVSQILRMFENHRLRPKTIAEVGCGAGEVLKLLQEKMDGACRFWGYDISPQAVELCRSQANERLKFKLGEISREAGAFFGMPRCIQLAKDAIQKIARWPRMICFSIHQDLTVRILGDIAF